MVVQTERGADLPEWKSRPTTSPGRCPTGGKPDEGKASVSLSKIFYKRKLRTFTPFVVLPPGTGSLDPLPSLLFSECLTVWYTCQDHEPYSSGMVAPSACFPKYRRLFWSAARGSRDPVFPDQSLPLWRGRGKMRVCRCPRKMRSTRESKKKRTVETGKFHGKWKAVHPNDFA